MLLRNSLVTMCLFSVGGRYLARYLFKIAYFFHTKTLEFRQDVFYKTRINVMSPDSILFLFCILILVRSCF